MKTLRIAVAMVLTVLVGKTVALDVPLFVQEYAGVDRVASPVNSGVPLPRGAVMDVAQLRLVDAADKPVLASIEPRCRWLGDKSLKWVTVHFSCSLRANEKLTYRLIDSPGPTAKGPLKVTSTSREIVVVTGPAKFFVPTDRLAPLSQVTLRTNRSKEFNEADSLLSGPAVVRLVGRNGEAHVSNQRSEVIDVGEVFRQTGMVRSAVVEERGPGRVVIGLKGTFSTAKAPSLDFTARLYFYANSPLVQMTLSVRNRQIDSMTKFVGIEQLSVEMPLKIRGQAQGSLSVDGRTVSEKLTGSRPLALLQSTRNEATIGLPSGKKEKGKKSPGWVRLASDASTLTAGNRWFWQTYPKGVSARPDGLVSLDLKPESSRRVDLFTAGAKTHFLYFYFSKGHVTKETPPSLKLASPQTIAAGTTHPLAAGCDPNWACQETRVFGDLLANNLELFDAKYHDMIRPYQAKLDQSLRTLVNNRSRDSWPSDVDEYGWLDFGSGLHHQTTTKSSSAESWWDSNYYDFPHAVLVNYLRTGDRLNLRTAEEAGLHLADIDICHSFPGDPKQAGSPRSGPAIGHFRNYARGTEYMGHNSFTFYKNESLYELYYLTGERWYQEVGQMSSNFAMERWGQGALRNVAHGIWGVLSAYHDTHDPKYLDRCRFFVDQWAKPWQDKHKGSFDDQLWMYGLQFEAYDKYYQLTGDLDTARYNLKAIDAMITEQADSKHKMPNGLSGVCLIGYSLAYEYTGDKKYFDAGLELLQRMNLANDSRIKTFALQFRASPYFLKVLTTGYRPGSKLKSHVLPAETEKGAQ